MTPRRLAFLVVLVALPALPISRPARAQSAAVLFESLDGFLVPVYCADGAGTLRTGEGCLDLVDVGVAAVSGEDEPVTLGTPGRRYCPGGAVSGFVSQLLPFEQAVWPETSATVWQSARWLVPTPLSDAALLDAAGLCSASAPCEVTAASEYRVDLDGDVIDDHFYLTSTRFSSVGWHDGAVYWSSGRPGDMPRRLEGVDGRLGSIEARFGVRALDLDGDGVAEVTLEITDERPDGISRYQLLLLPGGELTEPVLVSCDNASEEPAPTTAAAAAPPVAEGTAPLGPLGELLADTGAGGALAEAFRTWGEGDDDLSGLGFAVADGLGGAGYLDAVPNLEPASAGSMGYGRPGDAHGPPLPQPRLTAVDSAAPEAEQLRAAVAEAPDLTGCYLIGGDRHRDESPSAVIALTLDRSGGVLGAHLEEDTFAAETSDCIERVVRTGGVYGPIPFEYHTYRFRIAFALQE